MEGEMAGGAVQGKGKGKGPPCPAKGKGKNQEPAELTLNSVDRHRSRMAALSYNGDTIEGKTLSGRTLFSFPTASFDGRITAQALRRILEEELIGDAFKLQVDLLKNGSPMKDEDVISDIHVVAVKWRKGWNKVNSDNFVDRCHEEGGIALPVETEECRFEDCRDKVLQSFREAFERTRMKFEEERQEWELRFKRWEQRKQELEIWKAEQDKQVQQREAQGEGGQNGSPPPPPPPPNGKARGNSYKGKGKGLSLPARPPSPSPSHSMPPVKVAGFHISKGCPGKFWNKVVTSEAMEERHAPIALPIETHVPNFQGLRQCFIDFQLCRYYPDFEEHRAREAFDPWSAEFCRIARQTISAIPAARPKADLQIPLQKKVDILETVQSHLGAANTTRSRIDVEIPVAAFGFCVDVEIAGKELRSLLDFVRTCDHVGLSRHSGGKQLEAEAARVGVQLKDMLPFLQVRALDELGRMSFQLYPPQQIEYVDPTEIVSNIAVAFTVGLHALPQSSYANPLSTADLCKAAINPRLYNEHKRLALEALAIRAAAKDSQLGVYEKKGLVTIGCLLATHSDAGVREQAQELLDAAITSESFDFVSNYFERRRYPLGRIIVQSISLS